MTTVEAPTALAHALAYAARGWRVFPLPPGSRIPDLPKWQERATTDPTQIASWWAAQPAAGIAIATGHQSGIWVLDIDIKDGHTGEESLAAHEAAHGPLPATYEVITGSGGRHLYYAWTNGIDVRNHQSGRFGDGLDVRGDGGYVVAPPTVHPDFGVRYELEATAPDTPVEAPPWLLELVAPPDTPPPPPARQPAPVNGDRPGDRWAATVTWVDLLTADGWTQARNGPDGEQRWVRPGKAARDGISATVDYRGSDTLKVFTSSHPHLHADATYTKLGFLAAVHHGGDHRAAARALAANGWRTSNGDVRTLVAHPNGHTSPAAATTAGTWPDPEPIPATGALPPPPLDAYPSWMRAQIVNVARQLGCDPTIPAVFALGAISVASLGHVHLAVRAGETRRSTGLYLALAGPPASGKSPALDFMFDPLRDHEEKQIAASAADVARAETIRQIAEKRAKELVDNAARTGDPDRARDAEDAKAALELLPRPPAGEMMTTNITPERLATKMQANGERMAIVSDESGVLAIDRYGDKTAGSNMDLHLQGFTGQQVVVDRQTAPSVRMRHPLLAIVCGVQPESLTAAMANTEFRTRGFASRFLTAATPHLATNTDIDVDLWDEAVGARYADELHTLAARWSAWSTPATLTISAEGRRRYSTWAADLRHREADGGPLEGESGWVSKMRDSVGRIAALFHLADGNPHNDPISDHVMARAITLGEWFILHHIDETDDTPTLARRLLGTLIALDTKDPGAPITKRMIARAASANLRKADDYAPPLALLADLGWVTMDPDTTSFAATTIDAVHAARAFRIHPDAATRHDATNPTTVDAAWGTSGVDHRESTNVAQVASVTYKGSDEPPPFYPEAPGEGPPATGATDATPPPDAAPLIEADDAPSEPGAAAPEPSGGLWPAAFLDDDGVVGGGS